MRLDLSSDEARALTDALNEYLPALRREASRTDQRALRHELVGREELLEHILTRLQAQTTQV